MADEPPKSRPIFRPLVRCRPCRRFFSAPHDTPIAEVKCGACGGDAEVFDLDAHIAGLPAAKD